MLAIMFLNDGTGDEIEGNYKWKVMINQRVLAEGTLKGHNRLSGWEGLVKYFVRALDGEDDKEFTKRMKDKKYKAAVEVEIARTEEQKRRQDVKKR